ncbi:hypothetical protein EZS27_004050, partial [termite gut metagenome]
MDFIKKNNFIVKHRSIEFFDRDLDLFHKHLPYSKLDMELRRVNSYNRLKLDEKMLFELLEKVTPEEVLQNREKKSERNPTPTPT